MDQKQEDNFRALLTEAIIKLCQMEAVYTNELRIEGTVCVVLDRASVMVAHFAECIGSSHSLDSERNDNLECVFKQHCVDGPSADNTELMLPEVKVEGVLPDDIVRTFEGVSETNSLSDIHAFCQAADKSLSVNHNNTAVDVKWSTGGQRRNARCQKTCKLKGTHHRQQLLRCHQCSAAFTGLAMLHMHITKEHGDLYHNELSGKKLADKSMIQHHTYRHCDVPLAAEQTDTNMCVPDNYEITRGCLEADGTQSLALLEALERKDYEKMIDDARSLMKETDVIDNQEMQPSHKYTTVRCRIPGKATIMQYFEKVHVETSHGLYQYKCCLCHKMFKLRTSLYEHINTHTGNRRYACDQCGDRFVHHSSLHNHVNNKHMLASQRQGMLRYLCTGCDRRFKFRSQFERHLRSNPDHSTKVHDGQ